MGLVYSLTETLNKSCLSEEKNETRPDGTTINTKKYNSWVTGTVVFMAGTALVTYIDGGNGMISNTFRKNCPKPA